MEATMMCYAKKLLFAATAAVAVLGCEDKPKLHVYTWADYMDPELIRRFEAENGCEVVIDTFDANETMFAKLMAGAGGYDLITPTEYVMPWLVKAGLVEELDAARLPNAAANLDEAFRSEWTLRYDVPYAFSCTGILWRKDKCPPDLAFSDWNDMFDPRLNGRVCIMDDVRELLGVALKTRGYSVNSVNQAEIDEAVKIARKWKAAAAKMDNESYRAGISSAEFYAAMSYNSDAIMLLADDDKNIGYSVPTNGTTSSVDVFCVMKSAPAEDLAYRFIDMFYAPSNAVQNSEYNGAPMPVKGLFEGLSDKYKAIPSMRVTKELKAKCEDIRDVGDKLDVYSKAWDRVKAK